MNRSLVSWMARLPVTPLGRLYRAGQVPGDAQVRLLRALIRRGSRTVWGREHDLASALSQPDVLEAFRERVPLCEYDDLSPYIDRVRVGDSGILWPGITRHFAVSGGTVSKGRIIPVTDEMLGVMTRSNLAPGLGYLASGAGAGFLGGKILSLPGGVSEDPVCPGHFIGEISGLMARSVPGPLTRRYQALPLDAMENEDWDSKLHRAVVETISQDIRAIVMVPSWTPLLVEKLLAEASKEASRQVGSVRDIWPRLQVFFSGGVALRSYRAVLRDLLGSDVDFIESYSASEGFFAFQDDPGKQDLLLHIDSGVFFEFVRVDDLGSAHPTRYSIGDVDVGIKYALFVTTCSGLWAYSVHDVVRFTSLHPPRIVVAGKTGLVLDTFGESVFADEVAQAVSHAADLTQACCLHHHITYAPLVDSIPQHELMIEFASPPSSEEAFVRAFDEFLRSRNRHYRIRRDPGAMAAPILTQLPIGTCMSYLRSAHKTVGAQTKLLSLSQERDVADRLHHATNELTIQGILV